MCSAAASAEVLSFRVCYQISWFLDFVGVIIGVVMTFYKTKTHIAKVLQQRHFHFDDMKFLHFHPEFIANDEAFFIIKI